MHHVIIRGFEKREIIADDEDLDLFVSGMGAVDLKTGTNIYPLAQMCQSCAYHSQKHSTGTLCIHEELTVSYAQTSLLPGVSAVCQIIKTTTVACRG
jgi:hypothetical protein